ncbi:MAG: DUF4864 domain-containing protein [Comamonadaceae bacterium]|nr:MAG: DUF4864 domain-containing protein [Comamonadaceae bacterium]
MRYKLSRRLALSAFAVAALTQGVATAAAVADADVKAIRAVVQAQMKAFAADDAKMAFSYAAPNIHQMFGTADNFLAMVKSAYPMVHRPASAAFMRPELQDTGEVFQRVQLTDNAGQSWVATYALDRQKDKTWRITGCVVEQNKGRSA